MPAKTAPEAHDITCICVDCETETHKLADIQAREDDSQAREERMAIAPQHPFAGLWG